MNPIKSILHYCERKLSKEPSMSILTETSQSQLPEPRFNPINIKTWCRESMQEKMSCIDKDEAKGLLKSQMPLSAFLGCYANTKDSSIGFIDPIARLNDQEIEELVDLWKKQKRQRTYVLAVTRYAEGPIPTKQYVTGVEANENHINFDFGYADDKSGAARWTQKKLDKLAHYFPKEAIEAMKEPVEDE